MVGSGGGARRIDASPPAVRVAGVTRLRLSDAHAEPEHPDAEVVRRVRDGHADAFAELVTKYRERYMRYAVRMLGNREDAEEALQDAFVRAYRGLDRLDEPARFEPWLFSILANRCRTAGRRRDWRERVFVSEQVAGDVGRSPEAEVQAWQEEIARALQALPVDQREAFVLHHVEGLDYGHMMELTGAGESALRMRVKRARERLVVILGGAR